MASLEDKILEDDRRENYVLDSDSGEDYHTHTHTNYFLICNILRGCRNRSAIELSKGIYCTYLDLYTRAIPYLMLYIHIIIYPLFSTSFIIHSFKFVGMTIMRICLQTPQVIYRNIFLYLSNVVRPL